MPVKRVVGAIIDHPHWLCDDEHVTYLLARRRVAFRFFLGDIEAFAVAVHPPDSLSFIAALEDARGVQVVGTVLLTGLLEGMSEVGGPPSSPIIDAAPDSDSPPDTGG